MLDTLTIRRPYDLHVHLRSGALLRDVLRHTASDCAAALVMPNTTPPVRTGLDVARYREEIRAALPAGSRFTPLMTVKVVQDTLPEELRSAAEAGAVAGKAYPAGVTTNSADGVVDFRALAPLWATMQELDLVLSIHGEAPGSFCLDRERDFLPRLRWIATAFPRLRIVLEHVSSAAAVSALSGLPPTVGATITAHHLLLTLDDVIGGELHPHSFCKPLAKRPEDRDALIRAATSGDPRFFLGSDSAPHPRSRKESADGCAGVFTAPILLPLLATIFECAGALGRLEAFSSVHGPTFYRLPVATETVSLVRRAWTVPGSYGDVVPFMAGQELPWVRSVSLPPG